MSTQNNRYVTLRTPVFTVPQLRTLGSLEYGLSVHCGIIVVWDEDYDSRVLRMIEDRFPVGSVKPIAVCEHEGGVSLLWSTEDEAIHFAPQDYETEGDCWCATHYFRDGLGAKVAAYEE